MVYANEAADATRDAAREQEKARKRAEQQKRQEAIRAARLNRGALRASAGSSGALDSSGFQGGQASIGSQLRGALNFSIEMDTYATQAAERIGNATQMENMSNLFGGVSSLALVGAKYAPTKPSQAGVTGSGKGGGKGGSGSFTGGPPI